ncbi:hypothetical protein [Roseicella sp. DB1501]|uniref:hypothetical protein n=1 Tax=Roseicella sp. DB1501 TaxID=2730925 RepID=UPI0014921543|nr:hypothetical protein [Roseicella sp. DB1501]NOG72202.1 hypothetical protein [Roseicella sp. DB1501]
MSDAPGDRSYPPRRPTALRLSKPCPECWNDRWKLINITGQPVWLCVECGHMETGDPAPER